MAKSGLKHIDVGNELSKSEWESQETHELIHGTEFPASPPERQLFYRGDEHKWYIYNGSSWVWLGGGGGGGSGDMLKSVYDTDDDGVVDNSEKLEGSTKAEVQHHTPKVHTLASHSSKAHSELTGIGANDHHSNVLSLTFIIDGGGSAITTGEKGHLEIPFACTITQVTMLADQSGSIVVDIWKDTHANFPPTVADTITASAKPTLSSAQKSQDATLSGWTTAITAGDILAFNVDSCATIERVTISLKVTKS